MYAQQTFNIWLLLLALCAGGCRPSVAPKKENSMTKWNKLPDLPGTSDTASLGVSAPFAGITEGILVVAGGCNFPDKPVTEGGQKRYYDDIFFLDLQNETDPLWQPAGRLPRPVAYGASVATSAGVICIGGNNAEESFPDVYRVSRNEATGKADICQLPSLPVSMDNFAAACLNNTLYVAGGNENGKPCRSFYALPLDPAAGSGWHKLPDFPGPARVQPVLAAQRNKEGGGIYLAGGFEPVTGDSAPVIPTDLLLYDPATREWRKEADLPLLADGSPRTLTGGCAVALGDSSLLLAGGVNYNRFLAAIDRTRQMEIARQEGNKIRLDSLAEEGKNYMHHPAEWYRFNTVLLRYNTFTREWENLGEYEQLARAGAGAVVNGNDLIIVNGELKPGIRTPQVNRLTLEE